MTVYDIAARSIAPEHTLTSAIKIKTPGQTDIRLVNNPEAVLAATGPGTPATSESFSPARFNVNLPNDDDKIPTAQIQIDNVGRALVQYIELIDGGRNSTIIVYEMTTSGVVQWDQEFKVLDVQISQQVITVSLGVEYFLDKPSVTLRYDPENAPGLF